MSFHPGVYRYRPGQWLNEEQQFWFRLNRYIGRPLVESLRDVKFVK